MLAILLIILIISLSTAIAYRKFEREHTRQRIQEAFWMGHTHGVSLGANQQLQRIGYMPLEEAVSYHGFVVSERLSIDLKCIRNMDSAQIDCQTLVEDKD